MVAVVEKVTEKDKHTGEVSALLPDRDYIYSGGADGKIKIWDQDLNLLREINAHKDYILSLAHNSKDELYSSSRDGTLRFFSRPLKTDNSELLLLTVLDDIISLYCIDDLLYSGDDKGIVSKWYHNQVVSQYNILEEVKSMAVEDHWLYTIRENDAVVSDITPGIMNFSTKAVIPGRAPLILLGPESGGHKKYVAFPTRDGKGLNLVRNESPFTQVWTKENAHEWIINALCACDEFLYTADFSGKVKKWNLDKEAKVVDEIDTGKCINSICAGVDHTVFVGDADGNIKRLRFK